MLHLPLIGITMGDPAGIGPEIILKALSGKEVFEICRPLVLGDPGAFAPILHLFSGIAIREISRPMDAEGKQGQIDLIAVSRLKSCLLIPGQPTIAGGKAMVECITKAVAMAQHGELAALVTCPISKILMQRAGHPFEGHTQLISHLTGATDYVMMLAGERLRVALVTIHCALGDVPRLLKEEEIYKTIRITARALQRDFGLPLPRVAVAALNPHAGESGLFGSEEDAIIRPAVQRAQREGYAVEGPLPADSLFYKAAAGFFEAVVAMYHDQGLIPLKLLHFNNAVNITLGLPIIRTSVDHGTAYDIAGTGAADPASLIAAVRMAVQVAENRARGGQEVSG